MRSFRAEVAEMFCFVSVESFYFLNFVWFSIFNARRLLLVQQQAVKAKVYIIMSMFRVGFYWTFTYSFFRAANNMSNSFITPLAFARICREAFRCFKSFRASVTTACAARSLFSI